MTDKFDVDLKFGVDGEQWLTLLADEKKLEVKRDREWVRTGNLFFEYEYKGRKSGVAVTEADYYCYILTKDGAQIAAFLFKVDALRAALRRLLADGRIRRICGGDGMNSKGLLVPLNLIGELIR